MNQLSDDYIRDLKPETMRYDVTLESDFVISVLPNGIKTWAFLYEYQGRQRRKTLGVYPDMSHDQATRALRDARAMIERLGGEIDTPIEESGKTIAGPAEAALVKTMPEGKRPAVLASGYRSYPKKKRRPVRPWGKYALYALGVLALAATGAGAWTLLSGGGDAPTPTPSASAGSASRPAGPRQPPRQNPFAATAVAEEAVKAESGATPATGDGDTGQAPGENSNTTTPVETPQPDTSTTPGTAAPEPATAPGKETSSVTPPAARAVAPRTPRVSDAAIEAPARTPAAAAATTEAAADTAAPVSDTADATRVPPPPAATSTGGSVPRAIVTSGVDQLEPIDNLNDSVIEGQGRFRSVFFFTELRNFSDGNVVHRWEYNGRLIADVPLKVRNSWRWRTYSSKDLLPGMTGDWSVAVVDAEGEVLARSAFRFED